MNGKDEKKEYIEIVHVQYRLDWFKECGPFQRKVAENIEKLEKTVGVNYLDGPLDVIPPVPLDTPIRVGGGVDFCVNERVRNLKNMGYKHVRLDKSLFFSHEISYKDAGFSNPV